MSSEPLELVQPGMQEGTFVSAEPAHVVNPTATNNTYTPHSVSTQATVVSEDKISPTNRNVPADTRLEVGTTSELPVQDPEYDPDVQGDFKYPAMLPQECCGCRPVLSSCCYKRRMGRAYVCCERTGPNPKVLCMCGAGWTTQIITIVLVFGISFAVYGGALRVLHWGFIIGAAVIASLGLLAIISVGCCDPGVFPRYLKKKEKHWRYCHQSGSYRPPGMQWCDETGVLIHDIDHFCPWSGTTIAKANMPYFHLFLSMVCVTLIYVVALVIIAAITQGSTATWPED
jgi:hypothetical protein